MLMVRDPAIKSIKDFKDNHRIAMPAVKVSMQAIMLQMAAAKEFGDAKFGALDHLTVSMAHPDATAAMLGGQSEITANFSSAPFQYRQMKNPNIRRILTSTELFDEPLSFNVIAATSKFRTENPKLYAAFHAALKEATDFINADKRKGARDLPEGDRREDADRRHHGGARRSGDHLQTKVGGIGSFVNFMAEIGTLKQSARQLARHVLPRGVRGGGGLIIHLPHPEEPAEASSEGGRLEGWPQTPSVTPSRFEARRFARSSA